MDWFVRRFIKSALAWLGMGVSLGVAMAAHPMWIIYRPAHVHMNLLGFVTMMIFGVAYHVVPRFFGHPLYSKRLAGAHWWLSNAGLALMVAGFVMAPHVEPLSVPVLATGGVLSALGAFAFIFNIWRTIDGPATLRRIAETPASRRPPLAPSDS
jgi:cbb3-type cytochrome oxidase subunit 1